MTDIMAQNFEGKSISIREDGYWNLTQMCQTHGRNVADFLRLKSTQDYLAVFYFDSEVDTGIPVTASKVDMGIPISTSNQDSASIVSDMGNSHIENKSPIDVVKGGRSQEQGTWGHEEVALKLAAWLNPKFEVWVYRTIKKLLRTGEVKLKDEIEGLRSALNQAAQTIEEYDVELALSHHKQSQYKREYLEAICLSHWEGDYSSYAEDPDCYQAKSA
ncbi:KilA-N domain-containing protein [Microcoleus sp. Pol11C1]|uniref:KilA-N domain-containing protein n=1 Tax=unclassified Microcoleus TaxID=2642155 RepID=UPI002FD3E6B0